MTNDGNPWASVGNGVAEGSKFVCGTSLIRYPFEPLSGEPGEPFKLAARKKFIRIWFGLAKPVNLEDRYCYSTAAF